jgi:hypothetical protein
MGGGDQPEDQGAEEEVDRQKKCLIYDPGFT